MSRRSALSFFLALCLWAVSLTGAGAAPPDEVIFARDIQPLFAKHCILCHGPDQSEAGLRLDLPDSATTLLDSGKRAIAIGDADHSELVSRVLSTDDSQRMPPDDEPLSEQEIDVLRKWINDGAVYETHWAYRPVKQPSLPHLGEDPWVRNPIDLFLLARLQSQRLAPSPPADPASLVKRLHYDLIGLPPTPSEVDSFVENQDANAYEAMVDSLLASPRFGERWGRHWLDKARYADSDGYEKDRPRPSAWRYRDWVIDAINRDMPFDEFTIEQLAGDLLPAASPMQTLATAFHRQTLTNTEGGTDQEEFRVEATFDRAETTGAVWMGLTMTCARCHSHKYDQISHREYYQLFAFFNRCNETDLAIPISDAAVKEYEREKQIHVAKLVELRHDVEAARKTLQPEADAWLTDIAARVAAAARTPIEYHEPVILDVQASSKAEFTFLDDKSFLVSSPTNNAEGGVPDQDKYTLVLQAPSFPLAGIRLEALSHPSLDMNGPGRAPNGNFVLSQLKVSLSDNREFKDPKSIEFASAEADHYQAIFPPEGALSTKTDSGWAISPQFGKDHSITFYSTTAQLPGKNSFLQLVLDQSYGGKHLIGRFRITLMSGFDPLRTLPSKVADAVMMSADKRTDQQRQAIVDHVATLTPRTAKLAKQIAALEKSAPALPMITAAVLTPAERTTHLLHRGDFLQPADEVSADAIGVIKSVHPLVARDPQAPPDRLDLARWLVDERHPLTPRVAVNHVWSHLFGRGIVPTVNDFGVRGELPTHPELLEWLAWQFPRDMHWSRKALLKTILMSATYRQSSSHRDDLQTQDPTNRFLARQNRWRVEAEVVRDLSLAVGGLLSHRIGGPSVFPPLPEGVAELSYANNFKWETSRGADRYRRGMYTFFKRTSPHPTLINFDCPDSNTTSLARETSNTPLQALATLNNEVFTEAAQAMAARVLTASAGDDRDRMIYALRLCIGRQPASDEIQSFTNLLNAARNHYRAHAEDATAITGGHVAAETPAYDVAAWVATVRMMLNLDEFIVRD